MPYKDKEFKLAYSRANNKLYYMKNRAKQIEKRRIYREANRDVIRQAKRDENKRNVALVRFYSARRKRSMKNGSTIRDLDRGAGVMKVYQRAKELTEQTGIKHVVDHIIPLHHKKVCGLHVPCNLRVMTVNENNIKNNSF